MPTMNTFTLTELRYASWIELNSARFAPHGAFGLGDGKGSIRKRHLRDKLSGFGRELSYQFYKQLAENQLRFELCRHKLHVCL
jgi:hypothetical protein